MHPPKHDVSEPHPKLNTEKMLNSGEDFKQEDPEGYECAVQLSRAFEPYHVRFGETSNDYKNDVDKKGSQDVNAPNNEAVPTNTKDLRRNHEKEAVTPPLSSAIVKNDEAVTDHRSDSENSSSPQCLFPHSDTNSALSQKIYAFFHPSSENNADNCKKDSVSSLKNPDYPQSEDWPETPLLNKIRGDFEHARQADSHRSDDLESKPQGFVVAQNQEFDRNQDFARNQDFDRNQANDNDQQNGPQDSIANNSYNAHNPNVVDKEHGSNKWRNSEAQDGFKGAQYVEEDVAPRWKNTENPPRSLFSTQPPRFSMPPIIEHQESNYDRHPSNQWQNNGEDSVTEEDSEADWLEKDEGELEREELGRQLMANLPNGPIPDRSAASSWNGSGARGGATFRGGRGGRHWQMPWGEPHTPYTSWNSSENNHESDNQQEPEHERRQPGWGMEDWPEDDNVYQEDLDALHEERSDYSDSSAESKLNLRDAEVQTEECIAAAAPVHQTPKDNIVENDATRPSALQAEPYGPSVLNRMDRKKLFLDFLALHSYIYQNDIEKRVWRNMQPGLIPPLDRPETILGENWPMVVEQEDPRIACTVTKRNGIILEWIGQ